MLNEKGFKAYKQYWEDQASFMNKAPWNKDKILKLTLSTDYGNNLKELQFSTHSLKEENGKPILRVNSMYGIFRAVQNGLGIAGLPNYIGREIGGKRLVKILPELQGPKLDFYIVYPMEMRNSKRIAVLRDFLIDQMKLDRDKQVTL